MEDTPVTLALRELHRAYRDRMALAVMLSIGAVAGLTGPFGTFAGLPLFPRLLFWLLIVFGTYGVGVFGATAAQSLRPAGRDGMAWRSLFGGLGASVPVTALVVLLTLIFFQDLSVTGLALHELFLYNLAISTGLVGLLDWIAARRPATVPPPAAPDEPAILKRLPREARGRLSHMSMADHYVEIFTDRGKAMVLMRLSDAIAETGGIAGVQIHRSHWVARSALVGLSRRNGRPVADLVDGTQLPVSRSCLAAVRAMMDGP